MQMAIRREWLGEGLSGLLREVVRKATAKSLSGCHYGLQNSRAGYVSLYVCFIVCGVDPGFWKRSPKGLESTGRALRGRSRVD